MSIDLHTDSHVHTAWCNHASGSMEEYVRAAMARRLERVIFLEHLEEGIAYTPRTWLTESDFDHYFSEGRRLRSVYGDAIEIGLGVEVGYNPDCPQRILERLVQRDWDRIGISYHFCRLPGEREHLNLLSRKRSNLKLIAAHGPEKLLGHYFDTLLEAVATIPGQVLCHLDAGLRHYPELRLTENHHEQIGRLLDQVKRRGMALEINTSGFDLRQEPFPRSGVIARALDRQIPLVAGSDAHRPAEVGRHFDRLEAFLASLRR